MSIQYGTIAISVSTRDRLKAFCDKYGYRQTRKADEAINSFLDKEEIVEEERKKRG